MKTSVYIQNYKSIKDISFTANRINLLVGSPGSGKSNILEALSLLSMLDGSIKEIYRVQDITGMFLYGNLNAKIKVELGSYQTTIELDGTEFKHSLKTNATVGMVNADGIILHRSIPRNSNHFSAIVAPEINYTKPAFRYYKFREYYTPITQITGLNSPFGENLTSLIYHYEQYREITRDILRGLGLQLALNHSQSTVSVLRPMREESHIIDFIALPDTIRRLLFHLVAIESNKGTMLAFEEPEAHSFPPYIKLLGERIAAEKDTQFFITTHSPYLVQTLIDRTPSTELSIFYIKEENGYTTLQTVPTLVVDKINESEQDLFFVIDEFFERESDDDS